MALSGFALAPVTAVLYSLVDEIAPPGSATEAFDLDDHRDRSGVRRRGTRRRMRS